MARPSAKSGQPYQVPGVMRQSTSPAPQMGRLPRSSALFSLTYNWPSGAKASPNGLRNPSATTSASPPSGLMRMMAPLHGRPALITCPLLAAVPNGRNAPVLTAPDLRFIGSDDSKLSPANSTSLHGTS